jgi:hypothetical protein
MGLFELIIGTLGGAALLLATFWLWSGKLVDHFLKKTLEQQKIAWKDAADSQLEAIKADLARGTAVATARVEYLRTLWAATHQYGGAIQMLASRSGDPIDANKRIEDFNNAISGAGVFIGHARYEVLLQRIGGPFIEQLAVAKDDAVERRRLFNTFQHTLWPQALGEIETLLSTDPFSTRLVGPTAS